MPRLKQEIDDIKRVTEIIDVLLKHGFSYYVKKLESDNIFKKRIKRSDKPSEKEIESLPRNLRHAFEELGGSFVKLGQLLSLRPDLIPKEFCDEFRNLQDNVQPFPFSQAKSIVERELKSPIDKVFSSFDRTPMAAASIGQVYHAKLVTGEDVVVKVQRPGIREKIRSDIDILKQVAKIVKKRFNPKIFDPVEIIDEFEEYTESELDYSHEAKNIDLVHGNFSGHPTKIPKVYWHYTTSSVIVIEYIDGKKLFELEGITQERKHELSKALMDTILKQVFIDGVFHADPHPGNILVTEGMQLALIDYGIVGYIGDDLKSHLVDLFIAGVNKDTAGIARSIQNLGVTRKDIDEDRLRNDIREHFARYYEASVNEIKLSELLHSIIILSRKHGIVLSKNFVLLAKSMVTLESVIFDFDPAFNPIENARPFVDDLIRKKFEPGNIIRQIKRNSLKIRNFLVRVPDMSDDFLKGVKRGEHYMKRIHTDLSALAIELDKSSNRISIAMIVTGLIIASSLTISIDQARIFGLPYLSFFGFAVSAVLMVWLLISILKEKQKI